VDPERRFSTLPPEGGLALPNGSKLSIEGKKTESKQRKLFCVGQVDSSTYSAL